MPKDDFHSTNFFAGTKVFEEALTTIKFLDWFKQFAPVQNILGPVEGQDIIQIGSGHIVNWLLFTDKLYSGVTQIPQKIVNTLPPRMFGVGHFWL